MPVDRDVVRRIGEDGRSALAPHQDRMRRLVPRVAAQNPVTAQQPEVADAADRGTDDLWNGRLVDVGVFRGERFNPQIDLAHVEADRLNVEGELDARQRFQLLGEEPVVPDRDLRQAIVGDHERLLLGFRQMIERESWEFRSSRAAWRPAAGHARQSLCRQRR